MRLSLRARAESRGPPGVASCAPLPAEQRARRRVRVNTCGMQRSRPRSAAIYGRISHDPSGERLGVQRQEADCVAEARRRGWGVVRVYVDDDRSAYNARKPRPEYQRLLRDIAAGEVDGVMVWRLDRLHRQPRELEEFIACATESTWRSPR